MRTLVVVVPHPAAARSNSRATRPVHICNRKYRLPVQYLPNNVGTGIDACKMIGRSMRQSSGGPRLWNGTRAEWRRDTRLCKRTMLWKRLWKWWSDNCTTQSVTHRTHPSPGRSVGGV